MSEKYTLTIRDFSKREGISVSTVKRRIRENKIPAIKAERQRGRKGNRFEIRIHYICLSEENKKAFLREQGLSIKENESKKEDLRKVNDLRLWQKEAADKRENIVKKWLAVCEDVPRKKKTKLKKQFAKLNGIGRGTLDGWVSLYKDGGYYALVPEWNNGNREKLINAEIAKFIERSYLIEYGPPLKKVWEDSVRLLGDKYPKHPSYRTFAHYVHKKWTPAQQLLIRDPEAWNRKYSPFVRRDWNILELNNTWIADAKQIDVACLYQGKPLFPWVSVFMDGKSRKFVGWIVTPTHNSLSIGQAFVYGVRQYGPPKTVYMDHGKDYKSKYISGEKVRKDRVVKLFEDIHKTMIPGILRDLGVEIFFAAPHNPREKIIEPNFGIFTDRLRHLPGYRGHNIKTRPKKLTQELKTGSLLSFEEISSYIDKFIEDRNDRIHSTTNKTPNSFYENFVPQIPSQAVLDYLLMDVRHAKVKDSVTIDHHVYRGEDFFKLAGETVEVRRDPKDITRAVIIYKGQLFGTASLEMKDGYRGPLTLEASKTCARERKRIRKYQEAVWKAEGIIDDPIRMEIEIEQREISRKRDIRPAPKSNIIPLHKKERLARGASKLLAQGDNEEFGEALVATGGARNDISSRYLGKLSFKEQNDDEEF